MRKVTITLDDGTVKTFDTIKEAKDEYCLGLYAIQRMASGGNKRLMRMLHFKEVLVDENRGKAVGKRKRSGWTPVKCVNEKGEVVESKTIRDALRQIGLVGKNISTYLDDGKYHFGWKFYALEKVNNPYPFKEPVSDDMIALIYKYATHYMSKFNEITYQDKQELIQQIACKVASNVSMHKYRLPAPTKKLIYIWCMNIGSTLVRKHFDEMDARLEPTSPDVDKDEFIDVVARADRDGYTMDNLIDDLPEHLQQIARLYSEGRCTMEILTIMHISHAEKKKLTTELVEYLKHNRR